ncbi:formin-binding protein 4-like [Euwallacea fornicatus]|uniref:formin-binding protein 4-like n=1 Tax=Euwallacea fornicatus TaxID=995702 RepID=UPI00338F4D6B
MDASVSDFLNEINELSSNTKNNSFKAQEEVWQECYDELTGYSYFWNTETDEVTWVPPKSYKPADPSNKKAGAGKHGAEKAKRKIELFVPPASQPISPVTSQVDADVKQKVYSIQESIKKPEILKENKPKPVKKPPPFQKSSDSEDEKIELITEYGGESDSEDEVLQAEPVALLSKHSGSQIEKKSPVRIIENLSQKEVKPVGKSLKQGDIHSDAEEDEEEIDLLQQIQQRAKELKNLGGEVPSTVEQIIKKTDTLKPVSTFSLVAGYNSESSGGESDEEKPIFPAPPPLPETAHSTLFPITKPIDVKDFISPDSEANDNANLPEGNAQSTEFDSKAFQRKRRIGISLVNTLKRPKWEETESTSLSFKTDNTNNQEIMMQELSTAKAYPGFQKGGVMFVKADVLVPAPVEGERKIVQSDEEGQVDKRETEGDYTVLKEKLLFLGEGREPVLPVQAMLIQAETLFLAMKEGGLKLSYLYKWLKEMCSELVKLEKEAAPEGWLLQWDRSHKRYFYQNQATGVSQWRYPEPDVTRCDDAMDISTTPPPQDLGAVTVEVKPPSPVVFGPHLPPEPPLAPSPPHIRSPTPPPPPLISQDLRDTDVPASTVPIQPPLPPLLEIRQPLPPGVDLVLDVYPKSNNVEPKSSDSLISALDSFYSEIAEVSTENSNSRSPTTQDAPMDVASVAVAQQSTTEVVKKKKKRVKLAQGLTMKQKGVSQLVEKWKNVQKSYGD